MIPIPNNNPALALMFRQRFSVQGEGVYDDRAPGGSMGANDVLALDANFTSWRDKRFPTIPKDLNVFEYYCAEQFLRSFDLSDSQIKTGLLGGPKDGGNAISPSRQSGVVAPRQGGLRGRREGVRLPPNYPFIEGLAGRWQ